MNSQLVAALAAGVAILAVAGYYIFLRKENKLAAAEEKKVERKAEQILRQEHSDPRPRGNSGRQDAGRRSSTTAGGNGPRRKSKTMRIQQPGK